MRRLVLRRLQFSFLRDPIRGCSYLRPPRKAPRPNLLPFTQSSLYAVRSAPNTSGPAQRSQSSLSPYLALLLLVGSAFVLVDYVATPPPQPQTEATREDAGSVSIGQDFSRDELASFFANMSIPAGFLGNLTAEQEAKLKEFWALVLKTFGVKDPVGPTTATGRPITPADAALPALEPPSAKKEKLGLFHRKHKESGESSGSSSPALGGKSDPEDKYGQTKELQDILATSPPAALREAFWSMVKKDHPDTLLLRFLRARKWDIQRALAMLISTMHWRRFEMHVDDDIMINGEGGALKDSQSSNAGTKKEGTDFLTQMRLGKSFIHGIDKEGRPICVVRVRLHKGGEQSEKSLERYTVYTIETCRLFLQPPVETATIIFDMTSFTMANMDYTPVKFMIKVFEANYPESLGSVLVHKAPWIFQGIWKIIRGWLDPVVASKVHFTSSPEDLQEFIPRSQIISELGGDEKWEYKYLEPIPGENAALENVSNRKELESLRQNEVEEYEQKTFEWIHGQNVKAERDSIAKALKENYWQLDPYIRARSVYDRQGMLERDGSVDFYPDQKSINGPNGVGAGAGAGDDDVD